MKKQYTIEEAYADNTEITFYEDGSNVGSTILSNWEVVEYLKAKEEDGWQKAYSYGQMEEAIEEINNLEDSLNWWKKHLKEIENNLIGE